MTLGEVRKKRTDWFRQKNILQRGNAYLQKKRSAWRTRFKNNM